MDYVEDAVRTESKDMGTILRRMAHPESLRLTHASFGIQTESGEVADIVKKGIFYGKEMDPLTGEFTEKAKAHMKEELGDLLWYIAIACDVLDVEIGQVMAENIDKLKKRYPDKFTDEAAIARADKADGEE